MGILFGWLSSPPDVAQEDWANFLNLYSFVFLVVLALTVLGTVLGYRSAARHYRVFSASDVFRPFTPMRWLLLAFAGATVAALVGLFQFHATLNTWAGAPGFASLMFLLTGLLSAILSYLLIVFWTDLTPPHLQFRPAPYLHKNPTR